MKTIGSLCTGYGGLDLAVEQRTGARTVWVSDVDKHANTILEQRFPHADNLGDLKSVDWASVPRVDILTAGYPCQPFSHAGNRKGTDDPRHIFPYIAEGIRVLRPRLLVLENVRGHLSRGFGDVLGALADLGYDARWGVVRASDAGAPHRRERVFIAAADTSDLGHQWRRSTWDWWYGPEDGGLSAAHAGGERHGGGEDGGAVGLMDAADAGGAPQRERAWEVAGDRGAEAASYADGKGLEGHGELHAAPGEVEASAHYRVAWGDYLAAIERWSRVVGRPAPEPTEPGRNGAPRLSPRFVEWMMGLPEGWVTDTGIPHNAQLKALGNGVVPQQAALALSLLGL